MFADPFPNRYRAVVALTFSLAGLQAHLSSASTYRRAGNFAAAWDEVRDAREVLAGLVQSASIDGATASLGQGNLDAVVRDLREAEADSRATDYRRLIRTRVQRGQ